MGHVRAPQQVHPWASVGEITPAFVCCLYDRRDKLVAYSCLQVSHAQAHLALHDRTVVNAPAALHVPAAPAVPALDMPLFVEYDEAAATGDAANAAVDQAPDEVELDDVYDDDDFEIDFLARTFCS